MRRVGGSDGIQAGRAWCRARLSTPPGDGMADGLVEEIRVGEGLMGDDETDLSRVAADCKDNRSGFGGGLSGKHGLQVQVAITSTRRRTESVASTGSSTTSGVPTRGWLTPSRRASAESASIRAGIWSSARSAKRVTSGLYCIAAAPGGAWRCLPRSCRLRRRLRSCDAREQGIEGGWSISGG
jgi:hypothetical protein